MVGKILPPTVSNTGRVKENSMALIHIQIGRSHSACNLAVPVIWYSKHIK